MIFDRNRRAMAVAVTALSMIATAAWGEAATQTALPLAPERSIEFTTDEGTWISIDVSPDGKTLVFDLLGRLYSLPIGGGEARPLTSGWGFDSQPRFSPDGRRIAFVSDRDGAENLWIADPDGSNARRLSHDDQAQFSSPHWLPGGDVILVSKQPQLPTGTFELWAYHVEGGAGVPVVKGKEQPDAPPSQWRHTIGAVASPDGQYLYYAQRGGFFDKVYNVSFPLSQIVRRNRLTGEEDAITAAPGSAFRPMLSPDGTQLIYGTRYEAETGLRILDLRTGEERWLKYPVQRDDQESLFTQDFLPGYAFTPDGREIVISYGGKLHRVDVRTGRDQPIPFTAKVSRALGPLLDFPARVEEGPVQWRILQGAAQAPGGKQLVFSAGTRLYVMSLPSGAARRLTKAAAREYQPAWSADGRWIAYVTWSGNGGHIWKVRGDGSSAPVRLTQTSAYYRDIAWSPDGSRIVALRAARQWHLARPDEFFPAGDLLDLVWVPAQGGPTQVISPARGAKIPHFVAAQPDRVYLYTSRGLISMRLDGSDRRTHLKISRKAWTSSPDVDHGAAGDEARISPDGRWVAIRDSSQLYLTPVPGFGGEPLTIELTGVAMPAFAQQPAVGSAGSPSSVLPVRRLTMTGADAFAWADDGATLTWTLGPTFFRQPVTALSAAQSSAEEIPVNVSFPRAVPAGSALLRGAKAITMRGKEIIENADILITNNRIAQVGPRGSFPLPQGVKTFDLSGATVVPGFIDIHPHWTEIRRGVLDPDNNWTFFATLAYGVTAGRDPQTKTSDLFAYQDLVDMGEIPGPRAYSSGPGIFPLNDFQSYAQVKGVVSRYQRYYRTKTLKSYAVGNRRQRHWMIQACKELGIMPTSEGGLDLKLDLTHMIDGFSGNEHSLPVTPLYKDVVQLMAQSRITYTPTLVVALGGPWGENYFYESGDVHGDAKVRRFVPHNLVDARTRRRSAWFTFDEHVFPRMAAQAGKMIEAGGRVTIGSHGQLQGLGYHWEMWSLASGGVSNFEVLKSATLRGAEAIGYAQDLGSIEPGKLADLVVLNHDPLQDIRNTNTVRLVMKNGELFEGDTLTAIWPARKPLPDMWWWNEGPQQDASPR